MYVRTLDKELDFITRPFDRVKADQGTLQRVMDEVVDAITKHADGNSGRDLDEDSGNPRKLKTKASCCGCQVHQVRASQLQPNYWPRIMGWFTMKRMAFST